MMNGSDAADQIVRYTLEGTEVALKLSGLAAKSVATYITAVMKDSKKTRGKTRITRMLREGKPMKIFQIPTKQLRMFATDAKRYGVLFAAVVDKNNSAQETDVMVFSKDAAKINRILDRLSLAVVDAGAIETEILESRGALDPFVQESGNPSEISLPSSNGSAPYREREDGARKSVKKLLEEFRNESKKPVIKDGEQLQQAHQRPKRKKKRKAKGR